MDQTIGTYKIDNQLSINSFFYSFLSMQKEQKKETKKKRRK